MFRTFLAVAAVAGLTACSSDGNPFDAPEEDPVTDPGDPDPDPGDPDPDPDPGGPIEGGDLPPGTAEPTPEDGIFRREPREGAVGNGFADGISYDAESDTFTVDNLAFDGDEAYSRAQPFGNLGPFAVYENANVATDQFSGNLVGQLEHRAIYGVSRTGRSQFAVVRTGGYRDFGFGGFVYQREGGVDLPVTGQATYAGNYAGLRDFDGRSGLEYTTADMTMAIDFDDFTDGDGVRGRVFNRRVFDLAGNDLTQGIIDDINDEFDASISAIPTVRWVIGPGFADSNGEMVGEIFSTLVNDEGNAVDYETGNYYAILSGEDADEIVGILVLESGEPGTEGIAARETGGFILYR